MLSDDDDLMRQLEAVAAALFGGHFTVMRFPPIGASGSERLPGVMTSTRWPWG